MDRWYRRAANVVWPRARTFAVRAKGDPLGAIHELLAPGAGDRELSELLESTVEITPAKGASIGFDADVADAELSTSTPSVELAPYQTEYTGDMGNYGNTMDRWYRRAAIVVWPRARTFAVQAKGDPLGAIHELLAPCAGDGDVANARAERVSTLLRFWSDGVRQHDQRALLPSALRLAFELGDERLATRLLAPFDLEAVTPDHAAGLLALVDQHGLPWFDRQLTAWMRRDPDLSSGTSLRREVWIESLPAFCTNLLTAPAAATDLTVEVARSVARSMVRRAWLWLRTVIIGAADTTRPSLRRTMLGELSGALLAILRSASIAGDPETRRAILDAVCEPTLDLTPLLLGTIDAAAALDPGESDQIGVLELARRCAETLEREIARPERAAGDWSITEIEPGCCNDCTDLAAFLSDARRQQLVWPLAKPRRQHIHRRIDEAELPVTHQTRRQGSPHKLVLSKTPQLFTRDTERRAQARSSLDTVQRLLSQSPT
jgi:hypothetical protein